MVIDILKLTVQRCSKLGIRVTWNADKVIQEASNILERGMFKAVIFAERKCKQLVSRGQPRRVTPRGVRGLDPSRPGTPPKVVTDTLRTAIGHEVVRRGGYAHTKKIIGYLGVRKGPAEDYGLYLELGTSNKSGGVKMAERPYLRRTVITYRHRLGKLIVSG